MVHQLSGKIRLGGELFDLLGVISVVSDLARPRLSESTKHEAKTNQAE
jgi:hypothetical protein